MDVDGEPELELPDDELDGLRPSAMPRASCDLRYLQIEWNHVERGYAALPRRFRFLGF